MHPASAWDMPIFTEAINAQACYRSVCEIRTDAIAAGCRDGASGRRLSKTRESGHLLGLGEGSSGEQKPYGY